MSTLKDALYATAEKRKTRQIIERYKEIIETIKNSSMMINHWKSYQHNFDYAKDIEFNDICNTIENIMSEII